MKTYVKIKRLFLVGAIALTLLLGTLGVANKIQAGKFLQMAGTVTTNGACWKCTE